MTTGGRTRVNYLDPITRNARYTYLSTHPPTMADIHQKNHDSSSSLSSSPTGTSYASSLTTPHTLSRQQSHTSVPTDDTQATSDSESSRIPPRRRPSRLNGSANSKEVHRGVAAGFGAWEPADEMTAFAARSDPRNYAATVSTNHSSIQEETKETFSGWLGKFGAIELENKGSVARDHLALGMCMRMFPSFIFLSHGWRESRHIVFPSLVLFFAFSVEVGNKVANRKPVPGIVLFHRTDIFSVAQNFSCIHFDRYGTSPCRALMGIAKRR